MRTFLWTLALALCAARAASAQQRDTVPKPDSAPPRPGGPADSVAKAKADSAAAADSAFFAQQLQKGGKTGGDSSAASGAAPATATGPINPRLLPDISAVGDLVGDLSPKGSTQEDNSRFGVREIELAVQAAVDPFFRGDVFLGISDLESISIEQAYLTSTSLPWGLEVRLGRFLEPVGKQNTTHRHDLHTIEYPYVIQRFFGPEGLKGTGIWASKIFAPFGFYQELQLTAVDRLGERPEGLTAAEMPNKELGGLGYTARLRNYWDLSQATNFELAASAATGRREQPVEAPTPDAAVNAVNARETVAGLDVTYRWRPLQQGLYKSFILQGEVMRQFNERMPAQVPLEQGDTTVLVPYAGPTRDYTGAYAFARWQLTRRLFLGSRYDWLQDPELDGKTLQAGSGYFEFFPSEFSKLVAGYEHDFRQGSIEDSDRILLQASFSLGPHKPHPF
jgi:hypothetical protein